MSSAADGPPTAGAPSKDLTTPLQTAVGDRYRIEGKLGEGGMATVFLAEDLKHHRKVAIKVLRGHSRLARGNGARTSTA